MPTSRRKRWRSAIFKMEDKTWQQLLDNDQYLKDQKDDEGFSVVDGKLCVTYERED